MASATREAEKDAHLMTATMRLNAEKHGVELKFPGRPTSDVLDTLKANGWRWSRFAKLWYNRDTEKNRAFAAEIAGQSVSEAPRESREDRDLRRLRSNAYRFSADGMNTEVYQNRNGRCEDAPCCGCCS